MTTPVYRRARYARRGPVPHELVELEAFTPPALQPGEARIEVLAAPINPSDLMTITGDYGQLPPLPAVGGNEGVGRVVEVAPDVDTPAPGTRVLLPVGIGSWATHVTARADTLVPLPDAGDPVQLSMLAINPPTAALLLQDIVDLQPGEWVIQNAANSAVGGYAVQPARARGLRTVNVVRRQAACAQVAAGADAVLVDGDDLAARVRDATGGAKIRLGIDAVGGAATDRLAQALAPGGTVVNYGAMGGGLCELSPLALIFRGITLRGFWLASWFEQSTPAQRTELFGSLAARIVDGSLHAPVANRYPLDAIADALAAAGEGGRGGKVVLVPNADPTST